MGYSNRNSCTGDYFPNTYKNYEASVCSKSCTLLTGYLKCSKTLSLFWSTLFNSYTRLQRISFCCWFIKSNSNLQSAQQFQIWEISAVEPKVCRVSPSHQSPAATQSHCDIWVIALLFHRLGRCAWSTWWPQAWPSAPQGPPEQGVQMLLDPAQTQFLGITGGHRRTLQCLAGQGDLGSWGRTATWLQRLSFLTTSSFFLSGML